MNLLKQGYKKIVKWFFSLIYGKITGIEDNQSVLREILKKQTIKLNNFSYNIYINKKCRLYTDRIQDTAIIYKNKILNGPSFQLRNEVNSEVSKNIVLTKGTTRFKKKIKGRVLSLLTGGAGNDNYFHWMYDVLPKIFLSEKFFSDDEIDFYLFPNTKNKFQKETIEALNLTQNKIFISEEYRHIQADEIIVTSHPWAKTKDRKFNAENIPIWITQWLCEKFSHFFKLEIDLPKRIFIDRSDSISNVAMYRKIINENEVVKFLKKEGFEIIKLASLPFSNQVKLFNNAEIIAGLHGAGFANMAFCKDGCKIIELKNLATVNILKNLSRHNNLNYSSIEMEPIEKPIADHFGFFKISLDELQQKIDIH